MSFEIKCKGCNKFLERPGALLFSPPAANDANAVNKFHLCQVCFEKIFDWLRGRGIL